ncbi:MAG: hypothetical protein ABR881_27575 [Candidatus Sulfotelmatobacter sp.]|jgi:hypothetical protein
MSAGWFDDGLIVRHLANEETSAQGSQPYGKAGSGFGPRGPAPAFASGALLFPKIGPDRDALVRQFLDHTPVRQYLSEVTLSKDVRLAGRIRA